MSDLLDQDDLCRYDFDLGQVTKSSARSLLNIAASTVSTSEASGILPIEFFKSQSLNYFQGERVFKTFLSSGTTQKDRSQSHFSEVGLKLYKKAALDFFSQIMAQRFPKHENRIQGYSLIPNTQEWHDSSLAQMLGWISEEWPLTYVNMQSLGTLFASQVTSQKSPVWLFGTAFHFVQLMDASSPMPLPPGSVIIETGGTKGKSREIPRDEFYQLLSAFFSIPQTNIISEYGMCELASQAYDVYDPKSKKRSFKFPPWVSVQVLAGLDQAQNQGEGCLLVTDPTRIDYPWPIRVQDIARLHEDQTFELLGRSPQAALKGCSLRVEELLVPSSNIQINIVQKQKKFVDQNIFPSKYPDFLAFFDDPKTLELLSEELGSQNCAKAALDDLKQDIPSFFERNQLPSFLPNPLPGLNFNWLKAIENSGAHSQLHNLIIAPSSHPIAALYPIALAAMSGAKVSVRLHPGKFLPFFIDWLSAFFPERIFTLPQSFRLGLTPLPKEINQLLVYGDDDTISQIKDLSPVPVKGFGQSLTLSAIDIRYGFSAENIQALVKDILSLGQKGCLSTRMLLLVAEKSQPEALADLIRLLSVASREFWQNSLSIFSQVAIDHEGVRYQENFPQAQLWNRSYLDDMLWVSIDRNYIKSPIHEFLSTQPFVLPIVVYSSWEQVFEDCRSFPYLRKVSISPFDPQQKLENYELVPLGQANRLVWDGFHEGSPLFS